MLDRRIALVRIFAGRLSVMRRRALVRALRFSGIGAVDLNFWFVGRGGGD